MSEQNCPQCGMHESDRWRPRWLNVPRNLFVLNGRIRARGESGGSHRVYGWAIVRERYQTMFGRSSHHIDRIVCPHSWHETEERSESISRLPRKHVPESERHARKLAKRKRGDRRGPR